MPTIPEPPSAATVLEEAEAALQAWAADHPAATLYDMEVAAERQVARVRAARVRAALVRDLVTTATARPGVARPVCPSCQAAMQQVGRQTRTVVLPADEPLTIAGPRYRCPACGAGLFPPR